MSPARPRHRRQQFSRVCILSDLEAQDFEIFNRKPDCKDHRHCKMSEAREMIREGWQKTYSSYFHPIAEIVGPHHIRMVGAFSWRLKDHCFLPEEEAKQTGLSTLSLVTLQLTACGG